MRGCFNFMISLLFVIPLLLSLRNQQGTETQITQIGAPTSPSPCSNQAFYASLLLGENGDRNLSLEMQAIPNQNLRGLIKKEVEQACPDTVSCAHMLSLAARNSVLLAGGPLYPVLIGKRYSNESFIEEALATDENPKSDDMDNIACTLHLLTLRRANKRETVSLVEIGKIRCDFIQEEPHPTIIALDLLRQIRLNCSKHNMKNNNICSDKVSLLLMSKPKPKSNHIESGFALFCIFPIPFLLALYLRR